MKTLQRAGGNDELRRPLTARGHDDIDADDEGSDKHFHVRGVGKDARWARGAPHRHYGADWAARRVDPYVGQVCLCPRCNYPRHRRDGDEQDR